MKNMTQNRHRASSEGMPRFSKVTQKAGRKPTKDKNRIFVFLTCLYVITWYLQLGLRIDFLGSIRFEFILGATLSFFAILKLVRERHSTPLKSPIIFFLSVIALYTLFSYDRSQSWEVLFQRVLKFSMMAAFFAAFVRTEWALKMVIAAFLLAMLKMGQEGFMGWITGGMVWENQGIPRLHGVTGLYRHPNSFSGMAVGCLPFIFYYYPISNWWQKLLILCLLSFCVIIIVFTGSRTGYVATILLALYFWREKIKINKIKYTLIGIFGAVAAFTLLPTDYKQRLISIYTLDEAEGSSSSTRIQILKDAIDVFITHPWGVGVNAFPSVRMEMFGRFQDTHNLYLELLTNMSILGVIAFFLLITSILRESKLIATDSKQPIFIRATANSIIAFVYARLFLGIFGMDTYEIYWWFSAGLTIAMIKISKTPQQKRNPN